jgi:hypothetical protein
LQSVPRSCSESSSDLDWESTLVKFEDDFLAVMDEPPF